MDADNQHQARELDQGQRQQSELPPEALDTSTEIASTEQASQSRNQDSQEASSASDTDADTSDMDGVGDGYRRRRAQLMAGLENGNAKRKKSRRSGWQQHSVVDGAFPSDSDSEFSSFSTSDDVEMSRLAADDPLDDDEETALTRKDKEHKKRKRRKHRGLDTRIGGSLKTSKQDQKEADRTVLKSMIINVLLIASWYLFSLSISIVSDRFYRNCCCCC